MARILLGVLLSLLSVVALAAQVRVLALFPGKALLEVDGRRKVLVAGQELNGVRLVAADPREARVLIDGRQEVLQLGNAVSDRYVRPQQREIRLLRYNDAFHLDGLINGHPVRMLVDTGANTVALSEREARRLGIPYVQQGRPATARTASGVSRGYVVQLKSLKIGGKTFNAVQAVVIEGDYPREVLLGMNVLRHFEMDHRGNLMILRTR